MLSYGRQRTTREGRGRSGGSEGGKRVVARTRQRMHCGPQLMLLRAEAFVSHSKGHCHVNHEAERRSDAAIIILATSLGVIQQGFIRIVFLV